MEDCPRASAGSEDGGAKSNEDDIDKRLNEQWDSGFCAHDPLWRAHASVFAYQVLNAPHQPGFCNVIVCGKRSVHQVALCGTIVELARRQSHLEFSLDDGSGVVLCVWWHAGATVENCAVMQAVQLGDVVTVWAQISEYQGMRQLKVETAVREEERAVEILHCLQAIQLQRDHYSHQFECRLPPSRKETQQDGHMLLTPKVAFQTALIEVLRVRFHESFSVTDVVKLIQTDTIIQEAACNCAGSLQTVSA